MKKLILVSFVLFFMNPIFGQDLNELKEIKASEITQPYTSIDVYGSLYRIYNFKDEIRNYYSQSAELGFRGDFAIKKFALSVRLFTLLKEGQNKVIDDVKLDFSYQIHTNTGFYNSTLITVGMVAPSLSNSDQLIYFANPHENSSEFLELNMSYMSRLKFNSKYSLYPNIEFYRRIKNNRPYFSIYSNGLETRPAIYQTGVRVSGTISYDRKRSFYQLSSGATIGQWEAEKRYSELNYNDLSDRSWYFRLKYQTEITQQSQLYLVINLKKHALITSDDAQANYFGHDSFRIG
jgi:hypothetical protein